MFLDFAWYTNKSEADPLGLVGISEGALKGDNPPKKAKSVLEKVFRFRLVQTSLKRIPRFGRY